MCLGEVGVAEPTLEEAEALMVLVEKARKKGKGMSPAEVVWLYLIGAWRTGFEDAGKGERDG